jgi:hypothetical protein
VGVFDDFDKLRLPDHTLAPTQARKRKRNLLTDEQVPAHPWAPGSIRLMSWALPINESIPWSGTPFRGYYLRGPVPLPWLYLAMSLPGKALAVYLLLYHQVTLDYLNTQRQRDCIPGRVMTSRDSLEKLMKQAGISRPSRDRAFAALEVAGLIRLHDRGDGKPREIELLMLPTDAV